MLSERDECLCSAWGAGESRYINQPLARQLGAREGDEIVLRVRKPTALGLDAAISPRNEEHGGNPAQGRRDSCRRTCWVISACRATRLRPPTCFCAGFLAAKVGPYVDDEPKPAASLRHSSHPEGRPAVVEPKRPRGTQPLDEAGSWPWLNTELARAWLPEDAGLSVRAVEQPASATGGERRPPLSSR